jgi:uncharacterized protein YfeS
VIEKRGKYDNFMIQLKRFFTPIVMNEDFEFSPEHAHPKAQALLNEDFYWSPVEEAGPFGSDDGADACYTFAKWRRDHADEKPSVFLLELFEDWGYPVFNPLETSESGIRALAEAFDAEMIVRHDSAVIAVGFAQFALEGKIDIELQSWTQCAIQRQLTDEMMEVFDARYNARRRELLGKMAQVVNQMGN